MTSYKSPVKPYQLITMICAATCAAMMVEHPDVWVTVTPLLGKVISFTGLMACSGLTFLFKLWDL